MKYSKDGPSWLPLVSTIATIATISGAKLDKIPLYPVWTIVLVVCISVVIYFVVREPWRTYIYAFIAVTNYPILSFITNNYPLLMRVLYNWPLFIVFQTLLLLLLVMAPMREVVKRRRRPDIDLSLIDPSYDDGYNDYLRSQYDDADRS